VDFHNPSCQEAPRSEPKFGICDGAIAYSSLINPTSWIAEVRNQSGLPVTLTAIDGCVILRHELPGIRRCDCMLTTGDHLYLVELKEEKSGWKNGAIAQLLSTIQLYSDTNGRGDFKHRKAFTCNRKSRRFQEIDHELNRKVFRKYGFRIDAQATIVVI